MQCQDAATAWDPQCRAQGEGKLRSCVGATRKLGGGTRNCCFWERGQ